MIIWALIMLLGSSSAWAQCKAFTKKQCLPQLEKYQSNGQYLAAVMFEGEEATITQTFYSDQDYRLVVSAQNEINGLIYFEVSDYRGNMIYSSKGKKNNIFDFDVESTQQFDIRIVVPGNIGDPSAIKKNGCVSIAIGYQD